MWKLVLVVGLTGPLPAAPLPKDFKKADDRTRLTGTWVVTKCNVGGKEMDVANTAMQSVTFDAKDRMKTTYKGSAGSEWTITLDPDATPKRMRWQGKDEKAMNTYDCAYALTPDGRLIISIGHREAGPPGSVEPGPNATVHEFKRADPK